METKVLQFLNRYNVNFDDKVLIGVSTGVDSMTLLTILQKLKFKNIIVAHVNHGVRKESIDEEKFIINYCHERNLKYYISHLNPNTIENNFQEEARNYRIKFFESILKQENCKFLLLAHHLNDDMETSIMKIIRGSNLKGYSGIDECVYMKEYLIIRPLLKVLKENIIKYAKDNNIKYFEDYTNTLNYYTRNRIRHHIIPEIINENESFHEKFLEFKETLNEASKIVMETCDKFIYQEVKRTNEYYFFTKKAFLSLSPFLQVEVLFKLLKDFNLSKANILELIKLIKSDKKNLKVNYKDVGFVKEYEDIYLFFEKHEKFKFYKIIDSLGEFPIDENRSIVVSKKNDISVTNLNKVWYNSNMLPIIARTKKPGDRISFSYGTKKVSKLLIDEKVGITKRDKVIILENNNQILAVLGYGKSNILANIKNCDIMIELKEKNNEY